MEDETKTDMYICLDIRFSNSRKTYSYTSDDENIEQGDFVVVPSRWCDTVVEVVNIGSYEEKIFRYLQIKMEKINDNTFLKAIADVYDVVVILIVLPKAFGIYASMA